MEWRTIFKILRPTHSNLRTFGKFNARLMEENPSSFGAELFSLVHSIKFDAALLKEYCVKHLNTI